MLLLGYEGLIGVAESSTTAVVPKIEDDGNGDLSKERKTGVQNYIEDKTLTEKQKDEMLQAKDGDISLDDLAAMFGGVVIKN